jgi:hypothetical protein
MRKQVSAKELVNDPQYQQLDLTQWNDRLAHSLLHSTAERMDRVLAVGMWLTRLLGRMRGIFGKERTS